MNDDFLKQFRKRPDPRFAEALYQKINKGKRSVWIMKRVAWTLATFALIFVTALAVFPTVRAATLTAMREVGILGILESSEYPGADTGEVTIVESEIVSLEGAQTRLGNSIVLPAYVPEGFELQPEVRLTELGEGACKFHLAELSWRRVEISQETARPRQVLIQLRVEHYREEVCNLVVGEGAVEVIEINGLPAAIVRGGWSEDSKAYESFPMVNVIWQADEQTRCTLAANEELVSIEDLVQMAESAS
jgi:hypothetical protein